MRFTALFFICLLSFPLFSQRNNRSTLKLSEIMKGKDFIGYWPEYHYWHVDGEQILFHWNPKNEKTSSLYTYNTKTKTTSLVDLENPTAGIAYAPEQAQFSNQYHVSDGNLWVWEKTQKKAHPVFVSDERISNLTRLTDPNLVCYQKGLNVFLFDAKNGTTKQLSFIYSGKKPNQAETDETPLTRQQRELFLFIQEKEAEANYRQSKKKTKSTNHHLYLDNRELDFVEISKDGRYLFIGCGIYPPQKTTQIEHHITADGYTQSQAARSKVGELEPIHTFFIQDLHNDTLMEIKFNTLPDLRKKPSFLREYNDTIAEYTDDRKITFHRPISSPQGVCVMDIRSYDNKDRWIVQLNTDTIGFSLIDHQHDEAWIGGPGISSWNQASGVLGFWNDAKAVYFQSEANGYSHLYSFDLKSQQKKQLTNGRFEILGVQLSKDQTNFYVHTNKTHPGNRDFCRFNALKLEWTPLLAKEGAYDALLSPDEKTIATLYSSKTNPWELYLGKNEKNANELQLTVSTTLTYKAYPWHVPKVITYNSSDNKLIHARLYEPSSSNTNKAAIIFVHGAGYLQNAHNYWSSYYREFMFHNLLVDNGYTILDIDYRASAGYGRDHRTAIYRHMGSWDLDDNISGKQLLVDSLGIDSQRVGIYGGSYGGFITLMALLTNPDEFACGAALRSVTDWQHYNHEYTSNILNYPTNDSLAYWRSSPINFAENLQKPLLMLHGMVDDNVQFQDIVRLSQRFIELEKKNWELAVYPVEAHGFVKPYSWIDEYTRIYDLFTQELNPK